DVEIDLGEGDIDARLVEQRAQALVLLGRKHDGRTVCSRREARERPGLAYQRLSFEPSKVDRVAGSFGARDGQARPVAEIVVAVHGRKLELRWKLTSAGLGRGEHGRLVQQRSRV